MQAYALKKHPAVLLNLAWSCLRSGHALEAERYFKQFLNEGKDITDKQRADANDGLTQSRAKLGRIEIQAAAGTDITIDGDHVGTRRRWRTRWRSRQARTPSSSRRPTAPRIRKA